MKGLRKCIPALLMAIAILTPSLAGASYSNSFLQVIEPDDPLPGQEERDLDDKKEKPLETNQEKEETKEEIEESTEEKEEVREKGQEKPEENEGE